MASVITWETGGAAGWQAFGNKIIAAVNFLPGGPKVRSSRTAGRYPVGTLVVNDEVVLTIRPGQALVIEDRMRPEDWRVK